MGKITIKHYLNVNLKPYIIRGKSYYSMYIMVIANRKSTKVKSITFGELYTEEDFEDIFEHDNFQIRQEISAIENICSLILDTFSDFDATIFSLYYSVLKDIFMDDIDWEGESYNKFSNDFNIFTASKNKLGIDMESFIYGDYSLSINNTHGMDLFYWYSEEAQNKLNSFLKQYSFPNEELQAIINKFVFLGSFRKFITLIKSSQKGRDLYNKYSRTFDDKFDLYYDEIYQRVR
jgi:hypothetical protein|nr:MAG TPA: hypothetical protein [Bacteriophage sp.]